MENEPNIEISINGEPFKVNRENTVLFTFIGKLAVFNHVFLMVDEEREESSVKGGYLFAGQPCYEELRAFVEENNYPQHINMNEVADCDRDAWETMFQATQKGQKVIDTTATEGPPKYSEPLPELTGRWEEKDITDLLDNESFPKEWEDDK